MPNKSEVVRVLREAKAERPKSLDGMLRAISRACEADSLLYVRLLHMLDGVLNPDELFDRAIALAEASE